MIFGVAFGALAIGGLLILLIARYSPDGAEARLEEQRRRDEAEGRATRPAIPFDEWRHLVIDLLEVLGFHIAFEHASSDELEIIARSTEPLRRGKFLVRAILRPPGEVVDQKEVIRLQESVRGEGAQKGIILTPYRIATDGLGNLEVDLELVDGKKLRALVEEHLPKKLDSIDGYRGF